MFLPTSHFQRSHYRARWLVYVYGAPNVTSILTNTSAMAALQTLRTVGANLQQTQQQVSTGLRVATASDNVAYWSIATTMRSDNKANSAAHDALGIGAQKVEVAYAGIDAVGNILSEFKAKLVAAYEPSTDKAKIQLELDQLKKQTLAVATSASFSGENWLNTDISDINDSDLNRASVVSSFTRTDDGVSVGTAKLHLSEISLFNENGGGLLQADTRRLQTLGGVRTSDTFMDTDGIVHMFPTNTRIAAPGGYSFDFTGPVTFNAGDSISFDVTVDVDNPAHLDPPYNPGKTTHVTIDRALVDTVLPGQNGVISTFLQYATVLNQALTLANTGASAGIVHDWRGQIIPDVISVATRENSGLDGSSVQITGFTSAIGDGGFGNTPINYGGRGSQMSLTFSPFEVYRDGDNGDGVQIDFNFSYNALPSKHYSFDRTYVNDLLGKDTGKIETVDEMVTLLNSLMGSDWPDVIIEATSASSISVRSDKAVDRLAGSRTQIGFTGIDVSIEPIPQQNFLDIDIVNNPQMLGVYTGYIEIVSADVTNAGAILGSMKSRIEMQENFSKVLMDRIDSGVGRLVDADMEEASARLAAQQTQQQLALQSLQIANASPSNLMSLFG